MRNTEEAGKTLETIRFSSRAVSRLWPNGFSITTLLHRPGCSSASPCVRSWSIDRLEQPWRDG